MRKDGALMGTVVVAGSAAVNAAHTVSHAGQHVMPLPAWQLAYIVVLIYAAPVVAAVLLWTRYCLAGAWLLVASMAGSLVFGFLYHFLLPGSDNVFTQPPGPWRTAFGVSAVLLVPLQGMGCLAGLWAARVLSDGRARPVGSPAGQRRIPGRSHR